MRRINVALLLMTLVATPILAQEPGVEPGVPTGALVDQAPYTLVYDHVTGAFTLRNPSGRVVEGWSGRADGQRLAAPIPPDRPVEVVIQNANTLLYEYSIEAEPVGDRVVRGCRDIGRDFVSSGFMVSTRALIGGDAADLPSLDNVWQDVERFREAVPPTDEEEGFGFGGGSAAAAAIRAAEAQYEELNSLLARVRYLSRTMEDSLRWVAMVAESTPIDSVASRLEASVERGYSGLSDPRLLPRVLVAQRQDVTAQLSGVLPAAGTSPEGYGLQALRLDQQAEEALRATEEEVRLLQEQLLELQRAKAASHKRYTLLPAGTYRRITIRMEPTELEGFRARAGGVQVYTRPHVSLLCNLSFGLTWMEPPVSYQADGGGAIENDAREDDLRTSAALFLHLAAPDLPLLGAFGVLGGLGLGAETAPDLYLGGSLRLFRPILINAGAVWQRQDVLPDGLEPGDPVTSPDLLNDLDRKYEPTLFIGVSYAP